MAINVKEFVKNKAMKMSEKDVHDVVLKYINKIESMEKEDNK